MINKISTFLLLLLVIFSPSIKTSTYTNICTNGKPATKLTQKDYMTEFAKGPCAPVILIPGLLGSVLQIKIDCPTLRSSDPTTFKNCGWSNCKSEGGETLEGVPDSEYRIWVPNLVSPMSLIEPTDSSRYCWSHLIQAFYDSSSGKLVPKQKPGLTLTIKGLTPETSGYRNSECGTDSVEDLISGIPNPEGTQYLGGLISRFREMGYRSGLTLQALPYDFRVSVGYDLASKGLPTAVRKLKELNNKKVVIASHSLGNIKTSYGLWSMSQQEKDSSIALYAALAPPFLGVAEPVNFVTCGDSEYYKFGFGINMAEWKVAIGTFTVAFELSPYPTYATQAGQPWMQKIMKRIDYENGKSSDPVFPFLPTKDKICYTKFTQKNCNSGLEVWDNYIQYQGVTYGNTNYRDWINQHTFSGISKQAWNTIDSRFEKALNLGVPIALIYSQMLDTQGKYNYKVDPIGPASQDRFCNAKEYSYTPWKGDTTVPSTSAVTPGIKWADDFLNKVPGAKPIKLVEVCSSYNVKTTPWDASSSGGAKVMNSVEYQGMPCDCDQTHDRHCDHNSMLFLPQLTDYITAAIQTEERTTVSSIVQGMTEQQLQAYQNDCTLIQSVVSMVSGDEDVVPEDILVEK